MVGIQFGNVTGTICALATGLSLAFISSWELTLIVLGLIPIIGVSMGVVMALTMGAGEGVNKAYSVAGEISAEAILNIRTVRALCAEGQSIGIFTDTVLKVASNGAKGALKTGFA